MTTESMILSLITLIDIKFDIFCNNLIYIKLERMVIKMDFTDIIDISVWASSYHAISFMNTTHVYQS